MDSCNIQAALQILQTNLRAPQNLQNTAGVHSLVAVGRIKIAAIKQAAAKFSPPPAKLVKRVAGESRWRPNQVPVVGAMLTSGRSEGTTSCAARLDGQLDSGNGPHTVRRTSGRRPRLPHKTADRRNLNLGSICRSLAHESSALLCWQWC